MKYRNVGDAILIIENEGDWYRKTINLKSTHEDAGEFIRATSNVCRESFTKLSTAAKAFLLFVLWDNQGKDTKILAERRSYRPNSIYCSEFEKLYRSQQKEATQPQSTNEKEETTMSTTTQPAFQTKHFVFGVDATTMSDDQLIEAIKKLEAEIDNLKQIKTKSTAIDAKRTELKVMLASVVELLDNR